MSDSTNEAVMESASSSSSKIKRWKISDGATSTKLPMDLIMEILKPVPAETLVNLCKSKPLASIIRDRHFKKLFLTHSSSRLGRLFVSFRRSDGYNLLSSSLPRQNPHPSVESEEGEALSVADTYLRQLPSRLRPINSSWIRGLICYRFYCFGRSTLMVLCWKRQRE
ncbi:hypothetical protein CARUB_v10024967mg [Capsella rubella]|uniref:F-box domain-containing protein n=1 Tax=Capsella rubella TaxID=81985 RepID=R0HXC2_9BRAS|nr:putative F-box protein At5g44220 [Capsella rubella]EOA28738.1 hypothetical protein CARUB_v10024967mg [Capsella rubella]